MLVRQRFLAGSSIGEAGGLDPKAAIACRTPKPGGKTGGAGRNSRERLGVPHGIAALERWLYSVRVHEIPWPHAPTHRLCAAGTYFVTCGTYDKKHFFRGSERTAVVHRGLLKTLSEAGWTLEAWAVFSNHYHFVAHCPTVESARGLPGLLRTFHARLGTWVNKLDGVYERKVWCNYWETRLTFQASYLARLNYVHQNAVHHGLVAVANHYPWCSAAWFERVAASAKVKSIYRFRFDQLGTVDEFQPSLDW